MNLVFHPEYQQYHNLYPCVPQNNTRHHTDLFNQVKKACFVVWVSHAMKSGTFSSHATLLMFDGGYYNVVKERAHPLSPPLAEGKRERR